ncbi:hypothetical protein V490_04736 [Pseudogymnoascus sp. VKM F-3557]|nr:hypothetical protein V490_04736 [Pseudogymnoascus sp. VKM F-3557]
MTALRAQKNGGNQNHNSKPKDTAEAASTTKSVATNPSNSRTSSPRGPLTQEESTALYTPSVFASWRFALIPDYEKVKLAGTPDCKAARARSIMGQGPSMEQRPLFLSRLSSLKSSVAVFYLRGELHQSLRRVKSMGCIQETALNLLCCDYRALNKVIVKNRYSVRLMDDEIDKLRKGKVFTKLDIRSAYHRICFGTLDGWMTAFRTEDGLFY